MYLILYYPNGENYQVSKLIPKTFYPLFSHGKKGINGRKDNAF